MSEGARRGVTRGYVATLVAATLITAAALVVAAWGMTALALGRDPVVSEVSAAAAPLILIVGLGASAISLWRQAIVLLRGRRQPVWGAIVALSVGMYLFWCLAGMIVGMSIEDTWLSPFAALLVPIWFVASMLFWAVLSRRVYTDRPPPQWPWERSEGGE